MRSMTALANIAGVLYGGHTHLIASKAGIYIYSGERDRFHEWEFREQMQCDACIDAGSKKSVAAQTVAALQDEPLRLAKEL